MTADRIMGADAAYAVGRFNEDGPDGYRAASMPDAPLRATRAEAVEDERAYLDAASAKTKVWRGCQSVSVGGLLCLYPKGHQASHGNSGAEWSVGQDDEFSLLTVADYLTLHDAIHGEGRTAA